MPNTRCPYCGEETVPDSSTPGKSLCMTCKKRYDTSELEAYWERRSPEAAGMRTSSNENGYALSAPSVPVPATSATGDAYEGNAGTSEVDDSQGPQIDPVDDEPCRKQSRWAMAALVLGAFSILNSQFQAFWEISAVAGIIACGLGFWRLARSFHLGGKGRVLSAAGIISGITGCALSVAVALAIVPSVFSVPGSAQGTSPGDGSASTEPATLSTIFTNSVSPSSSASPWEDLEFSIGDATYSLMASTMKDLSQSGWTLDLAAAGYENGYMVEPNQMISLVELSGANEGEHLIVNAANFGDAPVDLSECVLTKMEYSSQGVGRVSIDGITCGSSWEEAQRVFGRPKESLEGDGTIDAVYESNGYSRSMQITYSTGDGNPIQAMSLSSMEY